MRSFLAALALIVPFSAGAIDFSYSTSNKASSNNLHGATVTQGQNLYIFYVAKPAKNLRKMNFSLDGAFINTDGSSPFKLYKGTTALKTSSLSVGSHTVKVKLKDSNNKVIGSRSATFNIVKAQSKAKAATITSVTVSGKDFIVKWTDPSDPSDGFQLWIDGVDQNSNYHTSSFQFTVSGLSEGEHCFKIESRHVGESHYPKSAESCATLEPARAPASEPAPSTAPAPSLKSVVADGLDFKLTWTQSVTPEGGFDIWMAPKGQALDDTGSSHRTTQLTKTISGLAAGEHCFKVEARFSNTKEFPHSNTLCATSTSSSSGNNNNSGSNDSGNSNAGNSTVPSGRASGVFFASNGRDSGSCTSANSPCKTLSYLGRLNLSTGTDIWLRAGDAFIGTFDPPHNGSSSNVVRVGSYCMQSGQARYGSCSSRAVLRSRATTGIRLRSGSDRHFHFFEIDVDGERPVTMSDAGKASPARIAQWIDTLDASYITFENMDFQYGRGYNCIQLEGQSHHISFRNINAYMCGNFWGKGPNHRGDIFHTRPGTHHILLENSTLQAGGHNVISMKGNYHVVRNNTFSNDWSEPFGAGAGYRIADFRAENYQPSPHGQMLIERNIFKDRGWKGFDGKYKASPYAKFQHSNGIYRFNRFENHDSRGNPVPIRENEAIYLGTTKTGDQVKNQRIYASEFTVMGEKGLAFFRTTSTTGATRHSSNNIFKNNFFGRMPSGSEFVRFQLDKRLNNSDPFDNNGFHSNCFDQSNVTVRDLKNGQGTKTLQDAQNRYSNFSANLRGSCSVSTRGQALTRVDGNSNGRTFRVDDPHYFSDGEGIVQGDLINVGNDSCRITDVNRSTRRITCQQSVNVSNNDPVNLAVDPSPRMGIPSGMRIGDR